QSTTTPTKPTTPQSTTTPAKPSTPSTTTTPQATPKPATTAGGQERVILVQINQYTKPHRYDCWMPKHELKKVTIFVNDDDVLGSIGDDDNDDDDDEQYNELGCMVPTLKVIFKDYTYVFSTYCTASLKFKNSSPYIPSGISVPTDFIYNANTLSYLEKLQLKHFGIQPQSAYRQTAATYRKQNADDDKDEDIDLDDDDLDSQIDSAGGNDDYLLDSDDDDLLDDLDDDF
ncbi:MAG: hypothetical protein LC115_02295, partial [Bacteroidia bacterium]|nr:hypothetical protein [Bacteroidia bacterium]